MSFYNTFDTKSNKTRKHIFTPFLAITFSVFLFSSLIYGNDQQQIQPRQRAINANKQLQDYHFRIAHEATKQQLNKQGLSPAKVGININRNLKKSDHIIFSDNMESGTGSWTSVAYSNTDIWHQTTINSSSPASSWWAGIDQRENYNTGTRVNCALISPAINLTAKIAPIKLLFAENYVTESGWDFCMVDVSKDGGSTWESLRGAYGTAPSGDSYGWTVTTLDLSAYTGQTIQLRFYLDTFDALYNDFPGWFVDD
jgi:hypothetical protein